MRRAYALSEEEFCRAEAELELAVLLGKHFCTLVALDVVLDVKHALQRLGDGSSQ